ncbi:rod-binding protein [Parvularcula dongshanensis]|uniref:Rod binding domain-containing protein n=1 Tax=Parvularcula dongshanensis TaxID=1173995 RepID=A0A840I3Q6_9PROT|nr:rod-binding protein [Parvularcula dongshanensis]MBB4659636.1 Rod binding domain-containing protein [Parvularcula dongshanensis]
MLKHAGVAEAFGAQGTGEGDAFSSFLLEAVADQMAQDGGIGLADRFYAELAARQDDTASTDATL